MDDTYRNLFIPFGKAVVPRESEENKGCDSCFFQNLVPCFIPCTKLDREDKKNVTYRLADFKEKNPAAELKNPDADKRNEANMFMCGYFGCHVKNTPVSLACACTKCNAYGDMGHDTCKSLMGQARRDVWLAAAASKKCEVCKKEGWD